jgi:hypothetical protein
MATWTLVTVGYLVPTVLGASGFKHAGELVARWGSASART